MLIADDDEDLRDWLAHALSANGFVPVKFSTGNDLLQYLGSWLLSPTRLRRPDAVLLDVCMPGFSGLQVLQGLTAATEVLPFIVMTARKDRETRLAAERLGAAAFLPKPLEISKMLTVMHAMVAFSTLQEVT